MCVGINADNPALELIAQKIAVLLPQNLAESLIVLDLCRAQIVEFYAVEATSGASEAA
jgi:hypothetical protein